MARECTPFVPALGRVGIGHWYVSRLTSHQQMRTDAEDGDFDVVFQLQRKELLQQLLALLISAVASKPQLAMHCYQEKQPQGPTKER